MARVYGSEEPGLYYCALTLLGQVLQLQDQGLQRWLLVVGREVCAGCHDLPVAHRAPGLFRAAQDLVTPVVHADFRQVVAANQHAIVGGGQQCGLEQALVIAQQCEEVAALALGEAPVGRSGIKQGML